MKPLIIGFAGEPGAGKDTAGRFLADLLNFKKVSFADRLKDALCLVYDLDRGKMDDLKYKETPHQNLGGMTPRKAMQLLGTEGFRNLIYDNTWIEAAYRTICQHKDSGKSVCIADVRFPNEAHAICTWGGHLAFVERPSRTNEASVMAHASEQHLGKLKLMADVVIVNDGDRQALFKKVLRWVDTLASN